MADEKKTRAQLIEEIAALRQRNAELEARQAEHQHTEKVQAALYRIADAASAVEDMQEFYAVIHQIVGGLVDAENFFIALYDEKTRTLSFPYVADAADEPAAPRVLTTFKEGGTGYILGTGKPLHSPRENSEELFARGEIIAEGTMAEDWIGIPLKSDDKTIGAMVVQSYEEGFRYTEQDFEFLIFVAQHIATALERARLLDDTRQRNTELAIINSVGEGLAKHLEFKAIIDLVGDKIRDIFQAHTVAIGFFEPETNLINVPYLLNLGQRQSLEPLPFGEGLASHVIRSGEPLVINQDAKQRFKEHGAVYPNDEDGHSIKSWVGVPIMVGDQAIGGISLQETRENAFTDSDVRLLSTLAANMGVALENARLFDETNRLLTETEERNAELAIINSVGEGLAKHLEYQAIIDLVGDKIREIFRADTTYIVIYDPKTNLGSAPYYVERGHRHPIEPEPPGTSFAWHIIQTNKPLLFNTLEEQAAHGSSRLVPSPGADEDLNQSYLGVPIHAGESMGALSVQDYRQHAYGQGDLQLLGTIAANLGVAIENARLFAELQQTNQELSQTLEELRTTQGQLVEAEKMAALGGLVAGVAHEINTPVGVGVTAASTLQDKTTSFSEIYQSGQMKRSDLEKYLSLAEQTSAMILRNLERAAELIQSFKQVAVDQSNEERREFPVKAYLDEILLSLRPKLKQSRHIIEINGDDRLTLDSYPGAFAQIVTNLVMNSLLHAYGPDEGGQLTFNFRQSDSHLIFEYNDDGHGIPAENLSKIFEPFFTTKRAQGGSGLGLHIIYNLVTQRLGGTIRCESGLGKGTKFVIEVPVA